MKIQGVGHVVLKVRDLDRAAAFYAGVLGLKEVGRFPERMAFFSAGTNHHDLAVMAMGPDAPSPPDKAVGLAHVAPQDRRLPSTCSGRPRRCSRHTACPSTASGTMW